MQPARRIGRLVPGIGFVFIRRFQPICGGCQTAATWPLGSGPKKFVHLSSGTLNSRSSASAAVSSAVSASQASLRPRRFPRLPGRPQSSASVSVSALSAGSDACSDTRESVVPHRVIEIVLGFIVGSGLVAVGVIVNRRIGKRSSTSAAAGASAFISQRPTRLLRHRRRRYRGSRRPRHRPRRPRRLRPVRHRPMLRRQRLGGLFIGPGRPSGFVFASRSGSTSPAGVGGCCSVQHGVLVTSARQRLRWRRLLPRLLRRGTQAH